MTGWYQKVWFWSTLLLPRWNNYCLQSLQVTLSCISKTKYPKHKKYSSELIFAIFATGMRAVLMHCSATGIRFINAIYMSVSGTGYKCCQN